VPVLPSLTCEPRAGRRVAAGSAWLGYAAGYCGGIACEEGVSDDWQLAYALSGQLILKNRSSIWPDCSRRLSSGAILSASGLAGHASVIHAERHAWDCNQVTATVPAGMAPRGIAMNPHTDKVYVADIGGITMTVIDGKTNKVTATIPVGGNLLSATVNPRTDTIYVANFASGSVPVINGRTNTVTATIQHVSGASQIALLRRTMTLYVTDDLADSLWVINARTNTVTGMISVGTGDDRAGGIAVDPKTPTIYLPQQNANTVVTINGLTNAITGTFPQAAASQPSPSPSAAGSRPST
jgi:YVTN family beta-propeller protein